MTSSVVGLRRSSKALPKARRAPKKGHGHSFVVSCSSDPLQLSEFQWNHYIWEVCSANRWDTLKNLQRLQPVLVNRKGPILLPGKAQLHIMQPTLQKLNELGYEFASSTIFTWALTNYLFFKHLNNFLQGKHFHNQQEAENAFQEFIKSPSTDLYTIGINKLIFHWQKCVDCDGSYFN